MPQQGEREGERNANIRMKTTKPCASHLNLSADVGDKFIVHLLYYKRAKEEQRVWEVEKLEKYIEKIWLEV